MQTDNLIAIDIHTHAEVSCRCPADNFGHELDEAAAENLLGLAETPTQEVTVPEA